MTKPGILLIGAGGHARSCIDVIEQHGVYQIVGLIDAQKIGDSILGYSILGNDDDLVGLAKNHKFALVTIGQIHSSELRIRLYEKAVTTGFQFPTIVSPTAYVSCHAKVGRGTIVMHGAVINAAANVGQNCIINSRSLIEHDATVGDHCHISTGVVLNGGVSIGQGSFIGSGSVIKDRIKIGIECVVGMGQVVHESLADSTQMKSTHQI